MAKFDTNTIFDINKNLFIRSTTDNLYIMPWKLLHEGYQVVRQDTVVRVDPDAGLPITHSKFTVGGRIISCQIFVDREEIFWYWFLKACKNSALPCWVADFKLNGFMRCTFLEQPTLSPAGSSILGMYGQLKLYAWVNTVPVQSFITENLPENFVTSKGAYLIQTSAEVSY